MIRLHETPPEGREWALSPGLVRDADQSGERALMLAF
jgi:hypothetical protein